MAKRRMQVAGCARRLREMADDSYSEADPMPKQVRCPKCKTVMKVPDSLAGKKVKCPKCGQVLQMPRAGAGSSPASGKARPSAPASPSPPPEEDEFQAPASDDEGGYALAGKERDDEEEDEDGAVGNGEDAPGSASRTRAEEEAPEQSLPRTCPNCGKELSPGTVICVRCGTNLKTGEQLKITTGTDKKAARRKRTNLFQSLAAVGGSRKLGRAVFGLILLGGGALGVYWFAFRKPSADAKSSGVIDEARALVKQEKYWDAYQKVSVAWVDAHRSSAAGAASGGPSLDDLNSVRDELASKVVVQLKEIVGKIGERTKSFFDQAGMLQETAGQLLQLGDSEDDKRLDLLGQFRDDWPDVQEAYKALTEGLSDSEKACGTVGQLTVWFVYGEQAYNDAKKDSPNAQAITACLKKAGPFYQAGQEAVPSGF